MAMQLHLRDSITIMASYDQVLATIQKPEQWPAFVHKIETLTYVNNIYTGIIRMGSRRHEFMGRLADSLEPGTVHLEVSFRDPHKNTEVTTSIVYRVIADPATGGVRVSEHVHYQVEVNPLTWLFVTWIQKFGRATEKSNLRVLKELMEARTSSSV